MEIETQEEELELDESAEDDGSSDEESENSQEDNSSDEDKQKQKKSNNFKKLRDENKALKKALQEEKNKKEETVLTKDQETESRFFFVENPEAKEMKEQIRETIAKFPSMSFEEAFVYAKAIKPKESSSKTDFNLRTKSKPADFLQLSDDEASEQLSPSEYLKYTRQKGSAFLKSGISRR